MATFKVDFETDNAAFEDDLDGEIAAVLERLAKEIRDNPAQNGGPVRDTNGNTVGRWAYDARPSS